MKKILIITIFILITINLMSCEYLEEVNDAVNTTTPSELNALTPEPTNTDTLDDKVVIITITEEVFILEQDQSKTLKFTINPDNLSEDDMVWKSSDPDIANVDQNGKITGINPGSCSITVSVPNYIAANSQLDVVITPKAAAIEIAKEPVITESPKNTATPTITKAPEKEKEPVATKAPEKKKEPIASKPPEKTEKAVTTNLKYNQNYAEEVLSILNKERKKLNLSPLKMNTKAVNAAQTRALETVTSFSHTRPNGSTPFTALDENKLTYSLAGENIAMGQRSPADVMTGWMNSAGHKENILKPGFKEIGIACYQDPQSDYGYYWVQLFIG